jgi:hypothetical protein
VDATLATARLSFHVDVNVGDPIWPAPEVMAVPRLRGGPAIQLAGYPLHMVHAEKIATAIQRGIANTRWRDFGDIWTLSRRREVTAENLYRAIREVAAYRHVALASFADVLAKQMTSHASDLEDLARTDPAFARLIDLDYARAARDCVRTVAKDDGLRGQGNRAASDRTDGSPICRRHSVDPERHLLQAGPCSRQFGIPRRRACGHRAADDGGSHPEMASQCISKRFDRGHDTVVVVARRPWYTLNAAETSISGCSHALLKQADQGRGTANLLTQKRIHSRDGARPLNGSRGCVYRLSSTAVALRYEAQCQFAGRGCGRPRRIRPCLGPPLEVGGVAARCAHATPARARAGL